MTANIVHLPTSDSKSSAAAEPKTNSFTFTKKEITTRVEEADAELARALKADPDHKIKPVIFRDTDTLGLILKRQRRDWKFAIERRINGKIFRHTLRDRTSSSDIKALRAEASDTMVQVRNGTFVTEAQRAAVRKDAAKTKELEDMTIGQALTDLRDKNPQLRGKTIEIYSHAVARAEDLTREKTDPPILDFVAARSKKRLRDLDLDFVRDAYDRVRESKSDASALQTLRVMRTIFLHWADELPKGSSVVPADPIRRLTKRKGRVATAPKRETAIPSDKRSTWFAAMRHEAQRLGYTGGTARALMFLYLTGMRRDEALGLRWVEVDTDTITIPAKRMKTGTALTRPITTEMRTILDEQRAWNPNSEFVFPSVRGDGHITDTRRTKAKIGEQTGVHISNHDLRRTYIGTATAAGVPEVAIKMLVAHTVSDITQQYAQSIRADLPQYAMRIEKALLK